VHTVSSFTLDHQGAAAHAAPVQRDHANPARRQAAPDTALPGPRRADAPAKLSSGPAGEIRRGGKDEGWKEF